MNEFITRAELIAALQAVGNYARMQGHSEYDSVQSARYGAKAEVCEELVHLFSTAEHAPATPVVEAVQEPVPVEPEQAHANGPAFLGASDPLARVSPLPPRTIRGKVCTCGTLTPCAIWGHS